MRVITTLSVVVAASLVACMGYDASPPGSEDQISFCSPDVSPTLVRGRSNFTVIYELELDDKGLPVRALPMKTVDGVGDLTQCLMDWRLASFSDDPQLKIVLSWVHARGWTLLRISGEERTLAVRIPDGLGPYGTASD